MKLETRKMEPSDLDRVCEIEEASFSMPWKREDFEDLLVRTEANYLVILLDDYLIGTAGYTFNGFEGYVNNVAIDPLYRGKDCSKVLMEALIEDGLKKGVKEFTLEVRVSNVPANRLYESLGFVSEGIRKNFYEKPTEDANVMWLRK
ncbi:MAG: ribosomal protein S18-alanine N-acetyltransferase [Lachnospiraceae bacterium]|nr:ribosomal protein S18-alanine N-acetyltransferase [Lachnospiraceae bacterium]